MAAFGDSVFVTSGEAVDVGSEGAQLATRASTIETKIITLNLGNMFPLFQPNGIHPSVCFTCSGAGTAKSSSPKKAQA